jgi:hypothetical protein
MQEEKPSNLEWRTDGMIDAIDGPRDYTADEAMSLMPDTEYVTVSMHSLGKWWSTEWSRDAIREVFEANPICNTNRILQTCGYGLSFRVGGITMYVKTEAEN